ncbi:MAG: hypothetical protein KJ822_04920 [Proteobacteria bacterium]|nr:hypothetical protein [Pseudomonadota bacterium]
MDAVNRAGKIIFTSPSGLPGQFRGGPAHFQNKQSGCLDRTGKRIWVDTD